MLNAIFGKDVFGQGQAEAARPAEKAESEALPAATIDIKHAIDSHVRWRQRLEDFIRGNSGELLSVESVSATDRCELGQWIHGAGRNRYGHLDLFTDLEAAHSRLHHHSGLILDAARKGNRDGALAQLQDVEYSRATAKVKNLLAKVYVEVLCAESPVAGHIDPHPPKTHRR